jgi:hypothetical protein
MNKKITTIKEFIKGAKTQIIDGSFHHSQNIEVDDKNPYLTIARKFLAEGKGAEFEFETITGSTIFNNLLYASNFDDSGGTITGNILRAQGSPVAWVIANANSQGATLGIFGDSNIISGTETGYLYYLSNSKIGRTTDLVNWDDDWQPLKVSNDGNIMPITKFLKYICFGNMNYLALWDVGNSSFDDDRLIFPDGYKIRWMKATTDYLMIGLNHPTKGGIIALWDGISTTYNSIIELGAVLSLGADVDSNICYIITDDGWVNYLLSGSTNLVKINRIPDTENFDSIIDISADAVKFYNGILHFGLVGTANLDKRCGWCGVWAFDPIRKSIYFKHTVSTKGIINVAGYGITKINSLMVNNITNELRVSWKNYNLSYIDLLSLNACPYGSFIITTWIDGENAIRKRFMNSIINLMKILPAYSQAKIILRYSETEDLSKNLVLASSGGTNYFVLSSSGNINVGDEVYVISGTGAGQIRNVIKKEIIGSTYKFTVDRILIGESFSATSYISVSDFKLIGIISGDTFTAESKLFPFSCRNKKIRLKIELNTNSGIGGQFDVGITNISTIHVQDKIIKS